MSNKPHDKPHAPSTIIPPHPAPSTRSSSNSPSTKPGPTEPVDPARELQSADVRKRWEAAKEKHDELHESDSPKARGELAARAEELLIALRDLGIGFHQAPVTLEALRDLYINGAGVHPRNAGERLAELLTVHQLYHLVEALDEALDAAAEPIKVG
jgi:hypothetical protein